MRKFEQSVKNALLGDSQLVRDGQEDDHDKKDRPDDDGGQREPLGHVQVAVGVAALAGVEALLVVQVEADFVQLAYQLG